MVRHEVSYLLTIIGCGNPNRSDDGAGVYVARKLQEHLTASELRDVRVFDAGTSGMEVMFQARGSTALIIIDANSSGSEPGAIFEVPGDTLANIPEPGLSLHNFRWDNAIYTGRKIFKSDFPERVTVYLIEAENLSLGLELTQSVQTAADKVIEKIKTLMAEKASA